MDSLPRAVLLRDFLYSILACAFRAPEWHEGQLMSQKAEMYWRNSPYGRQVLCGITNDASYAGVIQSDAAEMA